MSLYQWSDRFIVGVPTVDDQHRRIFRLANELHVAASRDQADAILETAVFDLHAYVEEHFDDEEVLMRGLAYPDYEEHREIHREMRRRVQDLESRYMLGEVQASEVHHLVVSWLIRHISNVDQRLAEYVRRHTAA